MRTVPARIKTGASWLVQKFKSLSLKRKLLVAGLSLILLIVISQVAANASKPPPYTTARVERSTITEVVVETGNIATNGRIDVYSPTNGIVIEVYVQNGDTVEKGDELFAIESSASEQEQAQAQASYLAAQNALDTANASLHSLQSQMFAAWDTYKELAENDTYENPDGTPRNDRRADPEYHVAEKDWLAAESNYKKQQAVIAQAKAAVQSTHIAYLATQNAAVKAPASGMIANLSVTPGNTVTINSPTAPVVPMATVASNAATEIIVSLSENDIAKVRPGQDAEIDVSAVDGKEYKGVVRRVDTIGTDAQGVIRYNIYVAVIDADGGLRPGMTADVEVVTKELKDVLSVPNAAVKPYQGGRAVRVVDPKTKEPTFVPVTIGVRGDERTEILKGVAEGQEVVISLSNEQLKRPGLF